MEDSKYRKGIMALIIDSDNKFFIVQLNVYGTNDWNFVGGGREGNETAEENLIREIKEETNLDSSDFEIIGQSSEPLKYEFPKSIIKGPDDYIGQVKDQFVIRINCDKSKIVTQDKEIRTSKWVTYEELKDHLIFPNQFESAEKAIKELLPSF